MYQNTSCVEYGIRDLVDFELDFVGGAGWSWRDAGAATAAGAVGGAVRFGVVAAFGGPVGWGAFGVATLAGGAAGLSAYAVIAFLD